MDRHSHTAGAAVDIGAFENSDCQPDGIRDELQLSGNDTDGNGVPDDCEDCIGGGLLCDDCDGNGIPDSDDIAGDPSLDCNSNGILDECDITLACSLDLNQNATPDECEFTWEPRADFNDSGSGVEGAAASIIDGKIYVSHGWRGGVTDTDALSENDIAADTWDHAEFPDAAQARSELGGAVAGGKHYAIGGRIMGGMQFEVLNTLEEFCPGSGGCGFGWSTRAPMPPTPGAGGERAGLGGASWDGKIYAIGGRTGFEFGQGMILGTNQRYNPGSNTWTSPLAPLPVPVSDNSATLAFNGSVYVFGGALGEQSVTDLVQIYDIADDTWSFGAPMPTRRAAALAGVVNCKIAVVGGYDPVSDMNLAVTEIYDPFTDKWFPGPEMVEPASQMAQGVTWDGSGVYAIGSGIFGAGEMIVQRLNALCRDVDGDCAIGTPEFLALLAAWGPCPGCLFDFDCDGTIGTPDFLALLAAWGPTSPSLEQEFVDAGLEWPEDWDTFYDCLGGTEEDRDRCICWLTHYLEHQDCDALLCTPPSCPRPDPFADPPLTHD